MRGTSFRFRCPQRSCTGIRRSRMPLPSIIATVLALLVTTLHAEIDRTHPPKPGPAPKVSFPDHEERTLSNGLKVFFVQSDREPMITFRMVVKAGSARDDDKSGLARILATMLSRGTETRDAEAFAEEIDFLGARFSAGESDDAIYGLARGLSKYTDEILNLFADAMLHPAFADPELALEKKKLQSALETERKDPSSLASRLRDKLIFDSHPYAQSPTPESVERIKREDLQEFHSKFFAPNNATLAVVGDFDIETLLPKLETAFGKWKPTDIEPLPEARLAQKKGLSIHLVDRPGSVQSNILVARLGVPRNDAHVPELQLLSNTLGGGMTSRLFTNLRETHGWTYGAYSRFKFQKDAGVFYASTEVRNEVTAPAIQETIKELRRISTEAIPDDELENQQQNMIGNFLLSLEEPSVTADRIQTIDLYGLPPDYYKTLPTRLEGVTSEQQLELAKENLGAEDFTIIVVGDAKAIRKDLEKLGKVTVYNTDLQPQ